MHLYCSNNFWKAQWKFSCVSLYEKNLETYLMIIVCIKYMISKHIFLIAFLYKHLNICTLLNVFKYF